MLKILNASPGFGAPLGEQDLKEFLTTKVLNLYLGTVDEKGHANIHPVGYYYDPLKNRFYILTAKESKKTHNLSRNETVYFCVDDPNPSYKGIRGKGTARILEEVNFNLDIWERIMARYIGNLEDPMAIALKDELKKGNAIVLEISPKYFSTWDYSKQ
ncbi:MAG: pyridoxamine 5'-phosphate oxidase family protein [Nitrososphaeraceae archaeon]